MRLKTHTHSLTFLSLSLILFFLSLYLSLTHSRILTSELICVCSPAAIACRELITGAGVACRSSSDWSARATRSSTLSAVAPTIAYCAEQLRAAQPLRLCSRDVAVAVQLDPFLCACDRVVPFQVLFASFVQWLQSEQPDRYRYLALRDVNVLMYS